MRRTDDEFKAEVFRRCEEFRARRRKRAKAIAAICLPILLCGGMWMLVLSSGFGGSSSDTAFDSNMSVECVEAPAAAAPEEFEADVMDGVNQSMSTASETGTLYDSQMPEDFDIRFVWAIGAENIYDTYEGLIQKDLVMDGTASVEFEPDREVLTEIYEKLLELDVASIDREMTSEVLTRTDEAVAVEPLTVYEIRFTMYGQTYMVTGDCTASCYPEDEDAAHFMEFVNFMYNIVQETPEYLDLPEASGGYD